MAVGYYRTICVLQPSIDYLICGLVRNVVDNVVVVVIVLLLLTDEVSTYLNVALQYNIE